MEIGVSVIICCYNSAERLPQTLKYLAMQQVPAGINWEIIVIDNASTDNTAIFAKNEWAKYKVTDVEFKIVAEPTPGLRYARKKGIQCAKYEYLLFCDDDNWLFPNYVSKACEIINSDPQIGVLGACGILEPEQPAWPEIEKFKSTYVNGPQTYAAHSHWVYGAGCVYRKCVLVNLYKKEWQQITSGRTGAKLTCGEDVEICFMYFLNGYKIVANDQLLFKHFVPLKRQNTAYITNMAFWLSYTNVLHNSYYAIIYKSENSIKTIINNWFLPAGKTLIKQSLKLLYQKVKTLTPLSIDEKIAHQSALGTFISLFKNRKRIINHHKHIIALLDDIGPHQK